MRWLSSKIKAIGLNCRSASSDGISAGIIVDDVERCAHCSKGRAPRGSTRAEDAVPQGRELLDLARPVGLQAVGTDDSALDRTRAIGWCTCLSPCSSQQLCRCRAGIWCLSADDQTEHGSLWREAYEASSNENIWDVQAHHVPGAKQTDVDQNTIQFSTQRGQQTFAPFILVLPSTSSWRRAATYRCL